MQIPPLFVEMNLIEPRPEIIALFLCSTIAFFALCGGVFRWSRTDASKMIALGILVAVVSVVYGALVISPTIVALSTGLMKIAFVLVLGGVACSVLSTLGGSPATDTTKPKETVHV